MEAVEAKSGDEVSIDTALTGLVHLARLLFQAPAAAFWVQERETKRLAACLGDEQSLRTAYDADLRSKFEDCQFVVLPDIKAEGKPFEFVYPRKAGERACECHSDYRGHESPPGRDHRRAAQRIPGDLRAGRHSARIAPFASHSGKDDG